MTGQDDPAAQEHPAGKRRPLTFDRACDLVENLTVHLHSSMMASRIGADILAKTSSDPDEAARILTMHTLYLVNSATALCASMVALLGPASSGDPADALKRVADAANDPAIEAMAQHFGASTAKHVAFLEELRAALTRNRHLVPGAFKDSESGAARGPAAKPFESVN